MGQKSDKVHNLHRVSGSFNSLLPVVDKAFDAGLVPYIVGAPGIGKSSMFGQIAAKRKLPLVVQVLSHQADPADLLGGKLPGTLTVDGKTHQVLHDCIPGWFVEYYEKNQPFLLFLDEIPNSPAHAATILNSIILERRIGQYKLPEGTLVACAGNRMEDQCMVYPLSAALQQRLLHLELNASVEDFTLYAKKKNFEPQLVAFLNWRGMEALISNEGPYPRVCPRVWEMADRMLKVMEKTDYKNTDYLGSVIGNKHATDYKVFLDVWQAIDLDGIFKGEAPNFRQMEESTKYAIAFAVATEINKLYREKKHKNKVDWKLLSNVLLADGFPHSLTTVTFMNLDEAPLGEAATEKKFESFVDKVIKLWTSIGR